MDLQDLAARLRAFARERDWEQFHAPKNLAMGVNETDPGGMVPEHTHETEEEVMFFISGTGTFVTEDEQIPLGPGVCVYNPPGGKHKIVNTGREVLKFVWFYAPQLPQHRVKEKKA